MQLFEIILAYSSSQITNKPSMSSTLDGWLANKFGSLPSFNCCHCQSGWKEVPASTIPWCPRIQHYKQCMQCNYHSQANMPHTRKVLKIHQNVKTSLTFGSCTECTDFRFLKVFIKQLDLFTFKKSKQVFHLIKII